MAILLKSLWEERRIIETGKIFEDSKFHGLPIVRSWELFNKEPAVHSEWLANMQVHLRAEMNS